ncbi:DUF3949 domain-containing protein [Rossellomorea marisflavi]|uniref:DUF3949 domain-containing protein n=1 Tax=Rossellomorea marisflavi TaxID=189381 RepID=UPI003F9FD7F6
METILLYGFIAILIVINLVFIPLHLRYLEEMNKDKRSQIQRQKENTFQEEVLHLNLQTNVFLYPSGLIAILIFKFKKR